MSYSMISPEVWFQADELYCEFGVPRNIRSRIHKDLMGDVAAQTRAEQVQQ